MQRMWQVLHAHQYRKQQLPKLDDMQGMPTEQDRRDCNIGDTHTSNGISSQLQQTPPTCKAKHANILQALGGPNDRSLFPLIQLPRQLQPKHTCGVHCSTTVLAGMAICEWMPSTRQCRPQPNSHSKQPTNWYEHCARRHRNIATATSWCSMHPMHHCERPTGGWHSV